MIASELPLKITENFYLPVVLGKATRQEYVPMDSVYTKEEAAGLAKEALSLFFEKLRIKGLQIIENNVKIEINDGVCTAEGDYTIEQSAVQERKPEETPPAQTEDSEEEREQT